MKLLTSQVIPRHNSLLFHANKHHIKIAKKVIKIAKNGGKFQIKYHK